MMEFERLTSADPLSRFGQLYDIYKRNNSNEKIRGFEINPLLLGVLHKKQFYGFKAESVYQIFQKSKK